MGFILGVRGCMKVGHIGKRILVARGILRLSFTGILANLDGKLVIRFIMIRVRDMLFSVMIRLAQWDIVPEQIGMTKTVITF